MQNILQVSNISKNFKLYSSAGVRIRDWLLPKRVHRAQSFQALKPLSFTVRKGECLGIIGVNGSGKSTLLKIITGCLVPTTGTVEVEGRVLSLLELGTGFNPELTGRQNVINSASLSSIPNGEINGQIEHIREFADLGEFFDRPLKIYSTGMIVRLAFAMFAFMSPDILIIDEALSVGDIFFQQKCYRHIRKLLKEGTTLLFVSHDMSVVRNLCDRVILLNQGEMLFDGDPAAGVSRYYATMNQTASSVSLTSSTELSKYSDGPASEREKLLEIMNHAIAFNQAQRHGEGEVSIFAVAVQDEDGLYVPQARMMHKLQIHLAIGATKQTGRLNCGIHLYDRLGNLIFCCGAKRLGDSLPALEPGAKAVVTITLDMRLQPGEYTFSLGVSELADDDGVFTEILQDRVEGLGPLIVLPPQEGEPPFLGIAYLPMEIRAGKIVDADFTTQVLEESSAVSLI